MNQEMKNIIKKSITENLPAPHFIKLNFTNAIGGWEVLLNNSEFRRFTIERLDQEDGMVYAIEARNLLIGNPKKREHPNTSLKVKINKLSNLDCPTFEDWLLTTITVGQNREKLQQIKDGIIKFIADDLLNLEQERHMKAFIESL